MEDEKLSWYPTRKHSSQILADILLAMLFACSDQKYFCDQRTELNKVYSGRRLNENRRKITAVALCSFIETRDFLSHCVGSNVCH